MRQKSTKKPTPKKSARKVPVVVVTPPAPRKPGESLTPDERLSTQDALLAAYAETGTISAACRKANIDRSTFYEWTEKDEAFGLRFNQAKERYRDVLRDEIHRRAVLGWDEDVYQLAKFAGTVRKYSDTLLIFHAKALMPEYREKQQLDVTTAGQPLGNIADGIGEALRDPEVAQSALALLERIASRHGDAGGSGVGGK